jgi:hypothetical protein
MKISKALKKAQSNYIKRNKRKGLTRVNVWVPEETAGELLAIAEEMREEMKDRLEKVEAELEAREQEA